MPVFSERVSIIPFEAEKLFLNVLRIKLFSPSQYLGCPGLDYNSHLAGISTDYIDKLLNGLIFGIGVVFRFAGILPGRTNCGDFFQSMLFQPFGNLFMALFTQPFKFYGNEYFVLQGVSPFKDLK
jgi:hypothetical protein